MNILESYSRRNNIKLYNVHESQAPLINTVRKIMYDTIKIPDSNSIIVDDIHRLGSIKVTRYVRLSSKYNSEMTAIVSGQPKRIKERQECSAPCLIHC